jgi:hypothetical protein
MISTGFFLSLQNLKVNIDTRQHVCPVINIDTRQHMCPLIKIDTHQHVCPLIKIDWLLLNIK